MTRRALCVLLFMAAFVGMVYPWDIATSSGDNLLRFYTNDTLSSTISIESRNIVALTYDEVHNTIIYVDKKTNNDSLCGYYLSSAENKCFIEGSGRNIYDLTFDPVTERVYFTDTIDKSVNWISVKSGSTENVNNIIKMDEGIPRDIVVDSCKGYVYWLKKHPINPTIEKARLDGTQREVFEVLKTVTVNTTYRLESHSLAIDPSKDHLFWIEPESNKEYRVFSGHLKKKRKPLFVIHLPFDNFNIDPPNSLTVTKNAVFNVLFKSTNHVVYSYLKSFAKIQRKSLYENGMCPIRLTANYKIADQIEGCEALRQVKVATGNDGPFCIHGTKVNETSDCMCYQGYTGERCEVSVCENYCLQGKCIVNEFGLPRCRCNIGYSGERCEVHLCRGYCLNDGKCVRNEEDELACECVEGFEGARCEAEIFDAFTVLVKYQNKTSTWSSAQQTFH